MERHPDLAEAMFDASFQRGLEREAAERERARAEADAYRRRLEQAAARLLADPAYAELLAWLDRGTRVTALVRICEPPGVTRATRGACFAGQRSVWETLAEMAEAGRDETV